MNETPDERQRLKEFNESFGSSGTLPYEEGIGGRANSRVFFCGGKMYHVDRENAAKHTISIRCGSRGCRARGLIITGDGPKVVHFQDKTRKHQCDVNEQSILERKAKVF